VRLLLDSHAILWWAEQHQLLSPVAYEAIADPEHELLISVISEVNGWCAYSSVVATTKTLPSSAYNLRPELPARPSLQGSSNPNSNPVYPGTLPPLITPRRRKPPMTAGTQTTFRFESGVKRTSECECRLFSPSER